MFFTARFTTALTAFLLFIAAGESLAFFKDIEKGVRKLGDAAADVVTLGEHGRNRDLERAKHRENLAAEQRKAAEKAKEEKLRSLQETFRIYQRVIEDFDFFSEYTRLTKSELEHAIASARIQVGQISWWQRYGFPRWRKAWQAEHEFATAVLTELESLASSLESVQSPPEFAAGAEGISQESELFNRNRNALNEARGSLANLREISQNARIEMEQLVNESLSSMNSAEAEILIGRLINIQNSFFALDEYTRQRQAYYQRELLNIEAQITALTAAPEQPKNKAEPAKTPPPFKFRQPFLFRR